MKQIIIALFLVMACGGCRDTGVPHEAARPATPPPPPPSPLELQGPALEAARAAGPGSCEEDVPKIKVLPMKALLGVDRHYDRITVHSAAYKDCLIGMTLDATQIPDPGEGPKKHPYALGDLAYDLLTKTALISYGDCIPSNVMTRVDISGSVIVYEWINSGRNREQLHRCLAAKKST